MFKNAKKEGMLYAFSQPANKNIVCVVLVIEFLFTEAAIIYFYGSRAVVLTCAMFLVFLYYRYKSYKEFGGITGDLAGWFLCLCEMAGAVICAFI